MGADAKVPCCPVNVLQFKICSSAKAETERTVAKSNCIMAHHGASWRIVAHHVMKAFNLWEKD